MADSDLVVIQKQLDSLIKETEHLKEELKKQHRKCDICGETRLLMDGLCESCHTYYVETTTCQRCGSRFVPRDRNDFIRDEEKWIFICRSCILEVFGRKKKTDG